MNQNDDGESHRKDDHRRPNTFDEANLDLLSEMRREMDELRSAENLEEIIRRTNLSFTTKVLNHPFPPKFRLLQLESYDGLKDPLDHIKSFKTLMHLQMTPNEVMCRAFPTIPKGVARVWFSKIPPSTIANFKQLSRSFHHFIVVQ